MNYKKELNKLRKHRKRYRPVMAMLMNLHNNSNVSDFPMELIDKKEILIILELLDIGYLNEKIIFPPVDLAERSGILAVGGDLSSERLIEAYSHGIFPWYSDGDPIIWWSPDPRFVLFPAETY